MIREILGSIGSSGFLPDITLALTQFALQAIDLGYGTCWIGAFDEAGVKRVLNIPVDKKVVICMTLGRPENIFIGAGRLLKNLFT